MGYARSPSSDNFTEVIPEDLMPGQTLPLGISTLLRAPLKVTVQTLRTCFT